MRVPSGTICIEWIPASNSVATDQPREPPATLHSQPHLAAPGGAGDRGQARSRSRTRRRRRWTEPSVDGAVGRGGAGEGGERLVSFRQIEPLSRSGTPGRLATLCHSSAPSSRRTVDPRVQLLSGLVLTFGRLCADANRHSRYAPARLRPVVCALWTGLSEQVARAYPSA